MLPNRLRKIAMSNCRFKVESSRSEISLVRVHFAWFKPTAIFRSAAFRIAAVCVLAVFGPFSFPAGAGSPSETYQKEIVPALRDYCYNCHGEEKQKGGVDLEKFHDSRAILTDPKLWQSVLQKVRDREMPPPDKHQPSMDERNTLEIRLRQTVEAVESAQKPYDPGRVLIHRLSRAEYNNTVRDLFGVDSHPADKFPSDGSGGGGFDNNADTLFIPPILMEKYLDAASETLAEAAPGKLFLARPNLFVSRRMAARQIAAFYAPRAFRRPVPPAEISRLVGLYEKADRRKASFEAGVKTMLEALLVSPEFLFRVEKDRPETGAYRISDYELASRLSYFLWASMPDEELFKLARLKLLHRPGVLQAQARRMLRDPKASAFADSFAGQWLGVKTLKTTTQPDPGRFPEFAPAVRDAMYEEAVAFFNALFRENRSLMDLLQCDYSYVNETLARFYGIRGVEGPLFRRVAFNNPNRGGVLGMAGVLTLTSYPQRTSPVLRGKWVLEQILGATSPPPPPNVGGLPADDAPKEGLTFRQRLEKHRSKPACASCHKRMDPIGFGLENFDAIGRWRENSGGLPVDSAGEMADGQKFHGPAELKSILMAEKEEFVRTITEKMLSYALGRGLEYYDRPTVRQIVGNLQRDGYRADTLVLEIVQSLPFQYRRNRPVQAKL